MGIDRIGKGGPPPVSPEAATGPAGPAREPFAVDRSDRAESANKAEVGPSSASPLARLRAGEIDVDRYVDLKVDEATAALHGLSKAELADVKQVLRDQLASDPGLSDLVRSAAGRLPTPPED
jgi:hypothetical protein